MYFKMKSKIKDLTEIIKKEYDSKALNKKTLKVIKKIHK